MEKIKCILLWIFNIVAVGAVLYVTFIEPAIENIQQIGFVRAAISSAIMLFLIIYVLRIVTGK